jgi:hypothetical protein
MLFVFKKGSGHAICFGSIKKSIAQKYHHAISLNEQALQKGEELVCRQLE